MSLSKSPALGFSSWQKASAFSWFCAFPCFLNTLLKRSFFQIQESLLGWWVGYIFTFLLVNYLTKFNILELQHPGLTNKLSLSFFTRFWETKFQIYLKYRNSITFCIVIGIWMLQDENFVKNFFPVYNHVISQKGSHIWNRLWLSRSLIWVSDLDEVTNIL